MYLLDDELVIRPFHILSLILCHRLTSSQSWLQHSLGYMMFRKECPEVQHLWKGEKEAGVGQRSYYSIVPTAVVANTTGRSGARTALESFPESGLKEQNVFVHVKSVIWRGTPRISLWATWFSTFKSNLWRDWQLKAVC